MEEGAFHLQFYKQAHQRWLQLSNGDENDDDIDDDDDGDDDDYDDFLPAPDEVGWQGTSPKPGLEKENFEIGRQMLMMLMMQIVINMLIIRMMLIILMNMDHESWSLIWTTWSWGWSMMMI